MNKILGCLIYVICAQFLFLAQASAQKAPTGSGFSTIEFDLNAKSLPPLFKGHDIGQLSLKLAAKGASKGKGEFETTEQWQQRINKEESEPILGGLLLSSVYAFALGGTDDFGHFNGLFEIKYDADKSTFHLQIESTEDLWDANGGWVYLRSYPYIVKVAETISDSGSQVGMNAYGATAKVNDYDSTTYAVEFSNARFARQKSTIFSHAEPIHGEFVAPSEQAPTIAKNIGVLAVRKLKAPFYKTGYLSTTATIDSPQTFSGTNHYVIIDLLAFWVYNRISGEVYTRIEPLPGKKVRRSTY